ncbi:MAG: transcriptional repressor [Candidatus Rokubacteria bacterium]|nr:transcriptional repressor [Candidatus Rokubacteria bacterium]
MIPDKERQDDLIRAKGMRLTAPRRIILDVLRRTAAHPSAHVVYRQVRKQLPSVSLATVYRNLRTLAAEGVLLERAGADGLRFDGNVQPHDHFTCLSCRRVFDVPPAGGVRTRRSVAARTGFEVLDHRVEFYGRCAACRGRRARRTTRAVRPRRSTTWQGRT